MSSPSSKDEATPPVGGGPNGDIFDLHELQKGEIFGGDSAAGDNHFEKQRPSPAAPHGSSYQYVTLDSWEKDLAASDSARSIFGWNFMVQGVSGAGNIGTSDTLDAITEVTLESFTIPNFLPGQQMQNPGYGTGFLTPYYFPGFPGLFADALVDLHPLSVLTSTFGWFPYTGRVTIQLHGTGLQAITQAGIGGAPDGGQFRYHFEADVIPFFATQGTLSTALGGGLPLPYDDFPLPAGLRVVPLPGFERYAFTEPLRDLHGLTVSFHSVDRRLSLPVDVLTGGTAYTSSGFWPFLGFTFPVKQADFGATWRFLFSCTATGFGAPSGQLMFSGLATADPEVNGWVNQAPGLVASIPQFFAPGVSIATLETDIFNIEFGVNTVQDAIAFTIAPLVDISKLVPAPPPFGTVVEIPSATPITVRFALARVRIPLRFKREVARLTNYS